MVEVKRLDIKEYYELIDRVANLPLPWEFLKNRKVLLSGASGMIGTFLIDVLMQRNFKWQDNILIIAIARNQSTAQERFSEYWTNNNFLFSSHDINLPFFGEYESLDYVVHAASNTHPIAYATDPINTIMTNVLGTYNLLNEAVRCNAQRFLFVSSVEIYGENTQNLESFSEDDYGYINCNSLRAGYPESKRTGESLCNAFNQKFGLEFVIARLCRVYGPTISSDDSKALSQFIRNAVNKEDIVLKSAGTQMYSYIHVADAASAVLKVLLEGDPFEAYNVSHHTSDISLKEMASIVARLSGTNVMFSVPNETEAIGFSKATYALLNSKKIEKIGWVPDFSIETGLASTIRILQQLNSTK